MATELFANAFATTLAAPCASGDATISTAVAAPAALQAGGGQFRIIVDSEIMIVTAGAAGTTWTATRGAEGSTAASHLSGAAVTHILTAGGLVNGSAVSITSPDSSIAVGGTPTAPTLVLPSSVANAVAQTGLKIPVANGSGGLSWLPETFVGKSGSRYAIVAGPIQNAGSPNYFQPITISNHEPCNIDSIVTTAGTVTAPGTITITHSTISAIDVVTLLVVPDETLANAGFIAGASVGLTTSVINMSQAAAVSDQVTYNGTSFVPSKTGATACFVNPGTFSAGTLTLTHPTVGSPFAVSLEPRSIDGTTRPYQAVIAQTAGVGPTSVNIEFWNQATGVKVTTADTNMKLTVTRPGFAQVNPQAVDTTAYPNSNLWVFGVFRTS